jgi:sec-independent protein translocase protein TatA
MIWTDTIWTNTGLILVRKPSRTIPGRLQPAWYNCHVMNLGFTEVIIIVAIVIVIFGANRLPELGRGLGKGIKNFKDATKEMSEKSGTDS